MKTTTELFSKQTTMSQSVKDKLANRYPFNKEFQAAELLCNTLCLIACEKLLYNWILLLNARLPIYNDLFTGAKQ